MGPSPHGWRRNPRERLEEGNVERGSENGSGRDRERETRRGGPRGVNGSTPGPLVSRLGTSGPRSGRGARDRQRRRSEPWPGARGQRGEGSPGALRGLRAPRRRVTLAGEGAAGIEAGRGRRVSGGGPREPARAEGAKVRGNAGSRRVTYGASFGTPSRMQRAAKRGWEGRRLETRSVSAGRAAEGGARRRGAVAFGSGSGQVGR